MPSVGAYWLHCLFVVWFLFEMVSSRVRDAGMLIPLALRGADAVGREVSADLRELLLAAPTAELALGGGSLLTLAAAAACFVWCWVSLVHHHRALVRVGARRERRHWWMSCVENNGESSGVR